MLQLVRIGGWEGVEGRGAMPEITSIVPSNQPRFKDEDLRWPLAFDPDGGGPMFLPLPTLLPETEDDMALYPTWQEVLSSYRFD